MKKDESEIIKIDITSIVSKNCKAYTIITSSKTIEIGTILLFKNNQYKVTSIDDKYGINAFKLLENSVSNSKYIHIDKDITVLTEMSKTNKNIQI